MTVVAEHDTALDVAAAIGTEIVQTAVWKGDRCNWVGAMPEEVAGGRVALTYRALGADLYDGSAGVGLFLAELSTATARAADRRTAIGALRHAVSRFSAPGDLRDPGDGLYTGRIGVAITLVLAARELGEPSLEQSARDLLSALTPPRPDQEHDLMSGSAGTALGLLVLAALLDDDHLLEVAVAYADVLLDAALPARSGLSWLSPNLPDTAGLTGYSHGAAGIATVLLEMSAATGDAAYRNAAQEAFHYERSLFDPVAQNWPDLRRVTGVPAGQPSFATFWCHGAPGCALARVRAIELGLDDGLRREALAGLTTTATWVRAGMSAGLNYSLCHGLAGNAEILLQSGALTPEYAPLAAQVAAFGASTYGIAGPRWPCGAHGGTTAGLFLGLAGIGRFYLRLARPELPSLLLIRPYPRKA